MRRLFSLVALRACLPAGRESSSLRLGAWALHTGKAALARFSLAPFDSSSKNTNKKILLKKSSIFLFVDCLSNGWNLIIAELRLYQELKNFSLSIGVK